jgi:F0F1-type ATP synthase membrane subunit b/b'
MDVETGLSGIARESIVLFTVIAVVIVAGLAWGKIVKPFMDVQSEMATKMADALRSIQQTSEAVNRVAESQTIIAKHLVETSENLVEVSRYLATQNMKA